MRANRVLQALFIVLAPLAVFFLYVRATRSSDFIVYYRASRYWSKAMDICMAR